MFARRHITPFQPRASTPGASPVHWRFHTAGEPMPCSVCGHLTPAGATYAVRWCHGASDADEAVCAACQPTVDLDDLDLDDLDTDLDDDDDLWPTDY